jgi:hypothetical protein
MELSNNKSPLGFQHGHGVEVFQNLPQQQEVKNI